MVLNLGLEAMRTGDEIDQQRFYQQQSDVCMLRLFDSFGESAPQLVFHLYVLIVKNHWTTDQALWTGVSAITSLVSLGWGIGKNNQSEDAYFLFMFSLTICLMCFVAAAYSSALRMIRADKNVMTWGGMIFQTLWRAGMLTARIVALVILALALDHWIIVIMCK